eukprot:scaffold151124_cov55-Attheya_sp.AAC.3
MHLVAIDPEHTATGIHDDDDCCVVLIDGCYGVAAAFVFRMLAFLGKGKWRVRFVPPAFLSSR